ncbi:MAG: T9SS type A sorting domain-containing protein [Ignavibacteriales bacterium]|nr:T9SS type A sorting domain-containing protein [Ignavibacteriales bacterium]
MHTRLAMTTAILMLVRFAPAYSQDCQDCKNRRVTLYDNEVNVPRPSANPDSIYRYWDYFFIAGGVKEYLANTDPTRDCIRRLDGAFFTKKDTVTSNIKFGLEHANLPPPGEAPGSPDYLLYGVVTAQSFTLMLETGKTRELVKSGVIALPAGFDPFQIGRTVAAFVGPLYTTIMDFERRKRDQGEPYAIQPKITLIPGTAKLKVNEKTNIDVVFKDCDGAPLKQRHITFTADGGTLKSADVTTDDQGRGTLEFTAGPVPALATVTSDYPYQQPAGYMSAISAEPASIQIDKPSTSWFAAGTFAIDNVTNLQSSGAFETKTGGGNDGTTISFSAWVTNMSPIPGQFSSTWLTTTQLKYAGSYHESYYEHSHMEVSAGGVFAMIDDQLTNIVNATSTNTRTPDLTISIYKNSYNISIQQMDAVQTGGETTTRVSVDPIAGRKTDTQVTPASPKKSMGLSVGGVNRDTVYSNVETTDFGDGRITKTVTQVTQQFSWKDNVCKLTYIRGIREDSQMRSNYNEDTYSNQTFRVTFLLSYTGDPPTWVEAPEQNVPTKFVLGQNYPNPFNPSTTISYNLPQTTHATLAITDLLGRKITTLVDEVRPAGLHMMQWNASGLPSGVYFLRMSSGGIVETRKLVLAK